MNSLNSNSVGLGASSSKVVTGKKMRLRLNGRTIMYAGTPSLTHQRLFWLLAVLGLEAPRWHLPVGLDFSGKISLDTMPD